MPDKSAIAKALRDIASLLELKGADFYKVRAYNHGAHAIEITDRDLDKLCRQHKLDEISGIGKALSAIIEDLYATGTCQLLDQLRSELPQLATEFAGIDGITIKRIQILEEQGIKTREDLLKACENSSLGKIKGLGSSFERKALHSLTAVDKGNHIILVKALNLTDRLLSYMEKYVQQIEAAGQVRRWQEVIERIDLVASSTYINKTKKHFEQFSSFAKCDWINRNTGIGHTSSGLEISLSIVAPEYFFAKLHEISCSPHHLSKLKAIAKKLAIPLYASKQIKSDEDIISAERAIYKRLHLPYIAPELRENWGEIEEAISGENFEDLIEEKDIQGMTHCHSNYSDGNTSIEKMALAAQKMGYSYITITDHSPNANYANGLTVDRLKEQWEEIARIQEKVKIKILRGTESDILATGQLDYPDSILEKFDIIIASIHARYRMNEDQMTQRIRTCMELPLFKVWGHALGRILLSRDPVPCRIEEILDVIANSTGAIEINGDPHRMDLPPFWLKEARKEK